MHAVSPVRLHSLTEESRHAGKLQAREPGLLGSSELHRPWTVQAAGLGLREASVAPAQGNAPQLAGGAAACRLGR